MAYLEQTNLTDSKNNLINPEQDETLDTKFARYLNRVIIKANYVYTY